MNRRDNKLSEIPCRVEFGTARNRLQNLFSKPANNGETLSDYGVEGQSRGKSSAAWWIDPVTTESKDKIPNME